MTSESLTLVFIHLYMQWYVDCLGKLIYVEGMGKIVIKNSIYVCYSMGKLECKENL